MRMGKTFFITMAFFVAIFAFMVNKSIFGKVGSILPSWQQGVRAIEREIEQLEEMKRGYEARALRHESQAQRLQFKGSEYITAKRHWDIAEENRKIAARIQEDIDQLKRKKLDLIQLYNEDVEAT